MRNNLRTTALAFGASASLLGLAILVGPSETPDAESQRGEILGDVATSSAEHTHPQPPLATRIAAEGPAEARIRELLAQSETVRNTTFVAAIQTAGFVCYGVERVDGGQNDSATWTVGCYDMHAYTVRVGTTGDLIVQPTVQYWDSIAPRVEPQLEPR